MTTSRVVRGSKGRILLGIFVIVSITIIIACFNNILTQLSDTRKNYEQCHQQQENLSTQLQVIFDYKQRLEKSLKTEKAEHQQSKHDFETKLEEEQTRHEKTINEVNLKFSSLQQHYNLLQTEYDDFKEESSKIQRQQLSEANDLQSKLKELQGQLKQSMNEKDKSFEHLKSQYLQIQVEKDNLLKQIQGTQDGNDQTESNINHLKKENFQLQREIDELKKKLSNKGLSETANEETQNEDAKKGQEPSEMDTKNGQDQLVAPKLENDNINYNHVLPLPNKLQASQQKSSTISSDVLPKASLDVQPINVPNITSSSLKINPSPSSQIANLDKKLPLPYSQRKLPEGVPPVLDARSGDDKVHKMDGEEKDVRDDVNNALPNRYRSNIILNEMAKESKLIEAEKLEKKVDAVDKENNALEVFDSPVNNIDGFGLDEAHADAKRPQKSGKQIPVEGVKSHNGQPHKAYDGQDNAEYDKEVPNDMQLEEEAEDEDLDYNDHIARQKDPAVRN